MKLSKYILILLIFGISCVKTDDYEIPKTENIEPVISVNSNILAIKSAYDQSEEKIYTFSKEDNSIVEGFVISSDESGNFYKVLVIQDQYENPTSGIEIQINLKAYFTKYNFGRKVFVKLAGLSVKNINGKYILGILIRNDIQEIPETLLDDYIIRSTETENIVAKKISLSDFKNDLIDTYVEVKNLQFRNDEIGKTFAGEAFDEFNGERVMVQCDNKITTILSTSTFSDFKSNIISKNSGNLDAVLTKDFYAEKFILIINGLDKIEFLKEERCDPNFLSCELKSINRSKILFFENFQELKKTKDLEALGWTNTNIYLGNERYNKRTSKGNISMQISAYGTEENPLEAWLITPPINFDNSNNEILTFDTKSTYDNGTILTVWASTDFKGDIETANWQQLNAKISVGPSNSFQSEFVSSGEISLECLEGNVNIAFKYLGGDPGISTTYDIDNVLILSN